MRFTKSKGTTLIDVLVTLGISLSCVILLLSLIQYGKKVVVQLDRAREQEWSIFLIQVEQQMLYSKNVRIEGTSLAFDTLLSPESTNLTIKDQKWETAALKVGSNKWINYSLNKGTNIILMNVEHITYEIFPRYIKINVQFTDDTKKSGVVARGFD